MRTSGNRPMTRRVFIACMIAGVFFVNRGIFAAGAFYGSGSGTVKSIALTFDDGPGPATVTILDILDEYTIKAAFFMLGTNVEKRPAIAREVFSRGHEVCGHTFSHPNLARTSGNIPELLEKELKKGNAVIKKVIGKKPKYVRIPHGYYRQWIKDIAKKDGVDIVHWTFGCDWQKMTASAMAEAYIDALKPGVILLFHDGGSVTRRKKTIACLPRVIEEALKQGYAIVSLDKLLESVPISPRQ